MQGVGGREVLTSQARAGPAGGRAGPAGGGDLICFIPLEAMLASSACLCA